MYEHITDLNTWWLFIDWNLIILFSVSFCVIVATAWDIMALNDTNIMADEYYFVMFRMKNSN